MSNIVLITGASSGFGEACARQFASLGARLILVARRTQRIEQLAHSLADSCEVYTHGLDIRDEVATLGFVDSLPAEWQNIDLLVNNAGLALGMEAADDAKLENWNIMVDTNIKGLMVMTRAVLPGMVARRSGHIINMGSIAGSYAYPGANVYGATKAFVRQFSKNLRADLLGKQVRVTTIEPGLSETEFSVVRFAGDAEQAKKVYSDVHPLFADDIARTIVWAATQPEHVNINSIEVMPTCQASGPLAISRNSSK